MVFPAAQLAASSRREVEIMDDVIKSERLDISIVIPLKDEAESLDELYRRLSEVLDDVGKSYELLFVDDGSTDESFEILERLHEQDKRVKVVKFRTNFGKAAAL
jgi:glycosyltransferase involved in cell wall biosynthesis